MTEKCESIFNSTLRILPLIILYNCKNGRSFWFISVKHHWKIWLWYMNIVQNYKTLQDSMSSKHSLQCYKNWIENYWNNNADNTSWNITGCLKKGVTYTKVKSFVKHILAQGDYCFLILYFCALFCQMM